MNQKENLIRGEKIIRAHAQRLKDAKTFEEYRDAHVRYCMELADSYQQQIDELTAQEGNKKTIIEYMVVDANEFKKDED